VDANPRPAVLTASFALYGGCCGGAKSARLCSVCRLLHCGGANGKLCSVCRPLWRCARRARYSWPLLTRLLDLLEVACLHLDGVAEQLRVARALISQARWCRRYAGPRIPYRMNTEYYSVQYGIHSVQNIPHLEHLPATILRRTCMEGCMGDRTDQGSRRVHQGGVDLTPAHRLVP
jgi:hypothetical protein